MINYTLIFLMVAFSFCKAQTSSVTVESEAQLSDARGNVSERASGIIFFSSDNGVSWENKSKGLPDTSEAGLGAIAVSRNSLGLATRHHGIYLFDFKKDTWVSIATDRQIIDANPAALSFYKDQIFVGTQFAGIFFTADRGATWTKLNKGLQNMTIRRLVEIDNKLYAGTNGGLYSLNDAQQVWQMEYGNPTLQVNGITSFDGSIYIATNQGAFTAPKNRKDWMQIFANGALHNISSDDKAIYAMIYNELFSSIDKGRTWQNIQNGLPAQLYTFNVIKNGNFLFAAQWDGVYRKDKAGDPWKSYSNGLPENMAVTNMKMYNGIIVVSGSKRTLKAGMTTDKQPVNGLP